MKYFKNLLGWIFAAATFSVFAQSVALEANQCRPEAIKRPTVVGMAVNGELSGFDPCHPSVSFKIPASLANSKKPPLVIAVHGGGGRADAETITNAFFENGMATLIFDAYKLILPLFSILLKPPIMRTSCLAAGPLSSVAQTSSG